MILLLWLRKWQKIKIMINAKKDAIQANAVELSRLHRCLVLNWSTGCGKTLATMKVLKDYLKQNPTAFGYLVCKESNHLSNWDEDIIKHKHQKTFTNTKKLLYASLHKETKLADYVILDECHGLTDKRVDALKRLIGPRTNVIFLSATIPDDKKILVQMTAKCIPHYDKISLTNAIDFGLLPTPKVFVHKAKLANDGNRSYPYRIEKGKGKKVKLSCKMGDMWKVLNTNPNITLDVMCNEAEYYQYVTGKMSFHYNKSQELGLPFNEKIKHKNLYLNLGSQRKRFIAQVKTSKSKEIIEQFRANKNRFITFTGSIEQSLYLGGNSSVNSKNHKDINKELIDGFNSKMYSELFAVGMLREGMNLTDIEKGLIIQLDSTIGSFFQMMGRMLRHQFPEIHMIKLEGTQDEKYFEKAMADFDEKYVTYI